MSERERERMGAASMYVGRECVCLFVADGSHDLLHVHVPVDQQHSADQPTRQFERLVLLLKSDYFEG